MTTIDTSTASAVSAATSGTSQSSSSSAAVTSDFTTFLKMLTVQLQNQDPLNPMDSTEYAVQLATFSNVEQQVKTNDLLAQMIESASTTEMAGLADWIGREVRVASTATFEGDPITISPSPADNAASAELVVRNSGGKEVNRFDIPVSEDAIEWSGVDSAGNTVAWGEYGFEIVSYDSSGNQIDSQTPQIYAEVAEARLTDGGVDLVLAGGAVVSAEDVTAIRSPD